jgi:hypothetical protein
LPTFDETFTESDDKSNDSDKLSDEHVASSSYPQNEEKLVHKYINPTTGPYECPNCLIRLESLVNHRVHINESHGGDSSGI